MWKISVEDDQGNKTTVNLVREEYTIGRAQENTVRLTERNISRRHALLRKNGTGWQIEDQSSYNGCFVNGARVCESRSLEHGDLIQLGDYRLRVVDEAVEIVDEKTPTQPRGRGVEAPSSSRSERPAASLPDRLVMLVGPNHGAEFALDGEQMLVGRGEECDVSINHSSVSRVHAEIRRLDDGTYEVIDQRSANGVRINGNELSQGLLESHDVLELGDITLKFIPAGESYVPPPPEELEALAQAEEEGSTVAPLVGPDQQHLAGGRFSPKLVQIGAAVIGFALVLTVVAVLVSGSPEQPEPPRVGEAPLDDASRALIEAKALLGKGQIEEAHQKVLQGVPEGSHLRDSEDFRSIEGRWADLMLERVAKTKDPDQQRALLDLVARTTTVDSTRRKLAADQLALLGIEGVDVSDLPSMKHAAANSVRAGQPPPAPQEEAAPEPVARHRAAPAAARAPTPAIPTQAHDNPYAETGDPPATQPPATSPPPAAKATASRTSGVNATEQATSGDRAAQIAAKNALKAKVAAGRATDREKRLLRALCRQFGDQSCAN